MAKASSSKLGKRSIFMYGSICIKQMYNDLVSVWFYTNG